MNGRREKDLAVEVVDFWKCLQSLPPNAASVKLEAAMQTWANLVRREGLYVSPAP